MLPERVLGNTGGLLHERVFKNLLSVDLLLQSAACNEPVNGHSLFLSDAVYSDLKNSSSGKLRQKLQVEVESVLT